MCIRDSGVTDLDATVSGLDALVDGILEKRRWMLDRNQKHSHRDTEARRNS